QNDAKACAFANQSYTSSNQAFLSITADLSGSNVGTCPIYQFSPPTTNPTNYAYSHRRTTSGDGTVKSELTRYFGTHTFGGLCSNTAAPTNWPGYFFKYDAGTSACTATAEAGVSSGAPSATTCGTISVWNDNGVTSFAV